MTKWELAQMLGAEVIVDTNTRSNFNITLKFGRCNRYFNFVDAIDYDYLAEAVFAMIRKAVDHSHNTWSHA